MALPTPANTTCQIYRAGSTPAAVWQDPCADVNGTDITAHKPTLPPTGVYSYCADNAGAITIESNTLQAGPDGNYSRFYFNPNLPDPLSASIDFQYTNAGLHPVDSAGASIYFLKLGIHYGNDAAGGEGYFADLHFNGTSWVLSIEQLSNGPGSSGLITLSSVNLSLSPGTWFTLQIGSDDSGNVNAAVVGIASTSAAMSEFLSNTQIILWTNASNEMAFRNIAVAGPIPCVLTRDWRWAQGEGERRVNSLAWTHFMFVDAAIDIRDGYTGACGFSGQDTVYVPDPTGTQFTVIFVELCNRGPQQYKCAFLDRALPSWPENDG